MSTGKRLRTYLIVLFGVIMAMMTFAGPANADSVYPPSPGTQVLGTSTNSSVPVAAATTTNSGLAFTGTDAIGIGALGGLLLAGGGALVLVPKGRKAGS
jgi:hypothetical protein